MIGHEWAIKILARHIAKDNPRHAYLLSGPTGVGRRTLALRLSQALNCSNSDETGKPCFRCRNCLELERMQHPDLSIVQTERRGDILRVEQIRELQRSLALAPYQAKFRIAILLRFEEANDNASNALLKTLEEPPEKVILILTANCAESLLPTIVSRCEVINLRPLPVAELASELLTKRNIPAEQANLLARLSNGCPGLAIQYQRQPDLLQHRNQALEELLRLLKASYAERFAYADTIRQESNKDDLPALLDIWISFWRDILLCTANASTEFTNLEREQDIRRLSTLFNLQSLERIIVSIGRIRNLLTYNINPRLAVEDLLLDLPRL